MSGLGIYRVGLRFTGSRMKGQFWLMAACTGIAGLLAMATVTAQSPIRVRFDRWLLLQEFTGSVTREQQSTAQPAKVGDKLEQLGDGITTGKSSSALLTVDTGIGFITVAESTSLKIIDLDYAPDNGRITRLKVTGGRVRLNLRRFTHPGSRLEIETPAGLSGVRGTEFGLVVQPGGKTSIAVLSGAVAMAAQNRSVRVAGGFQALTIPGEPPLQPVPLRDDPTLQYTFEQIIDRGVRRLRVVGQVDPVNSVIVDGVPQATDRYGRFRSPQKPLPKTLRFKVVVTTPLGKERTYDVAFP
jgi:hypothetical protein